MSLGAKELRENETIPPAIHTYSIKLQIVTEEVKYLTIRATDGKEAELEFGTKNRSQRNVFTVGQKKKKMAPLS